MAISKSKKTRSAEDEELIKSEVASFASSLGLATAVPSSGFDDSDFRKTGPMKPPKPSKKEKAPNFTPLDDDGGGGKKRPKAALAKKSPLENLDPFGTSGKATSKKEKLPLMKASGLSGQWYADAEEMEVKVLGEERGKMMVKGVEELKALVAEKKDLAARLLQQYTDDYHSSRKKNKDLLMVENAVRSGTTADRVSALTCLVEDNPIANLKSIDSLLHMVTTKVGKRYAFTSFDALKELFLFRLLPDRKLKCLLQRPLDGLPDSKDGCCLLLFWYWEENLKNRYEQFVIALEEASKDLLPNLKDKAVKLIYSLLRGKAEQERRLLSVLVNKLGDPVRKSASCAGYQLSCLLSAHPNMKAVVIDEVDSFIFRPHMGLRAKYHAVNFLSQILLTKTGDGPKVAKRLVDVYFALFKVLISEANENSPKEYKNNKYDHKFVKSKKGMIKGIPNKNHFLKKTGESPTDRNVEMDSRLLSALLTGVNRAFPYVASDEIDDLIEVQTPILFRLVHSKNFNVGVQALMLLYQISSKNQIASDRFYRALYSKLLIPAAMNTSKPEMFLGLLVKAMKDDINIKRIAAFAKRILQVSLQQPPQYACGCLFMLSEVLKARPPLWNLMLQTESVDDDIEHFNDIIEDPLDVEDAGVLDRMQDNSGDLLKSQGKDSLVRPSREGHNSGVDSFCRDQNQTPGKAFTLPAGYDPRHREPCYCNADRTNWWELTILASHAHPSVATMARTLLSGQNIVYNGDPLNDLSLIAFLDKFMEKKPKSNQRADGVWHGGSQIAPARKLDMNNQLIGEQILQLTEEDVPPEDVVFHRFYMNKCSSSRKKKKMMKKASEDDEAAADLLVDGGSDESDNEEIDNVLGLGTAEEDEDYDYDDLDKVANEDEIGENDYSAEDWSDKPIEDDKSKKRKSKKQSKASPFASIEDYEHLLNDDDNARKKPKLHKKTSDLGNARKKSKKNKKT